MLQSSDKLSNRVLEYGGVPTFCQAQVGVPLTLKVKLAGEEKFPVEGVHVALTIHSNKGVSATFCSIPCGYGVGDDQTTLEATTNEVGVASFEQYGVGKPGGYMITADFKYPPPPAEEYPATVTTSVFSVKQ